MRVLITAASSRLSRELSAALSRDNDVLLTDRSEVPTDQRFVSCDLGHDRATNDLVRGMDAIVHSIESVPGASAATRLDVAMRCTYNLLTAARSAGVGRFVNLSTLRLLDDYPENLTVTENWRPTPGVEPVILSAHLCEFVCREFGREGGIKIANLRLGFPIVEGDTSAAASSGETAALAGDDLATAINAALIADLGARSQSTDAPQSVSFRTIHVQSPIPNGRFLLKRAASILGLWEGQGAA